MRFHGVSKNYERVCDYFHYTGKYRAAAQYLQFKIQETIKNSFGFLQWAKL